MDLVSHAKRNDASSPGLHGFVVINVWRRQQDPLDARRFELLDACRTLMGSTGDSKAAQEVVRDQLGIHPFFYRL